MTSGSKCKACEKELYRYNTSGYCRPCWSKSDEKRARTSATVKRHWRENPELRERYRQAGIRNLMAPGVQEKRIQAVKDNRTWEIASQYITPEARQKANIRAQETRLGHIPREYRDEYRRLRRSKQMTAAEAAEVIRQQHETDMARFRAKLTGGKQR